MTTTHFQKTIKRQPKRNLLTISQAAARLGVHPDTLRNWEKRRILMPIRIGKGDKSTRQRRYTIEQVNGMAHIINRTNENPTRVQSQGRTGFLSRLFGR